MPGSPEGANGYTNLASAMAEQWREHLALILCYLVIGAYWLQHHYSGRIYAKSDHWFSALNLLFLLAIVVIPYPIRAWCFHLGRENKRVTTRERARFARNVPTSGRRAPKISRSCSAVCRPTACTGPKALADATT